MSSSEKKVIATDADHYAHAEVSGCGIPARIHQLGAVRMPGDIGLVDDGPVRRARRRVAIGGERGLVQTGEGKQALQGIAIR